MTHPYDDALRAAQARLAILLGKTRVTSPFSAVIEGKPTGLAGCATQSRCAKPQACMRAHPLLELLAAHQGGENCPSFIAGTGPIHATEPSTEEGALGVHHPSHG